MHLPVSKLYAFLRASHARDDKIIFESLIDASRSHHLGKIEDQQQRLKKLLWLTRNITRPPSPATYETLYNF